MALTKAKKAVKIEQARERAQGLDQRYRWHLRQAHRLPGLRAAARWCGAPAAVTGCVKNKLAARASKGTKVEQALQGLKGVSSVAYTSGDPVALAKALSTWMAGER